MDERTIDAYSTAASRFATEWRDQPLPTDMHALLRRYFIPGGRTADIGCGAGRDVAWLNGNGFPAVGYDAADGLLVQAAADYPSLDFRRTALPALDVITNGTFDNVLCETVIMHLPPAEVTEACARLVDILRPAGVLYLSWRVAEGVSTYDAAGRLYAAFDVARVHDGLGAADILLDVEAVNASSGKRVQRIVARRR
jgi:SAM-dependent methyltransferase